MTPPVSTFRVERPCGRLWRRARYGSAPPASRVADAIAARRPAAALDPGASANPGAGDAGRPRPARLGRAAPCNQVSRSVPRPRSSRLGWSGRGGGLAEFAGVAVFVRVVGDTVDPTAVDDPDPGAGQHLDRVRVVVAAGDRRGVDVGGPRTGVSAVVGETGDGLAEVFVAGPPEMHGTVLPGCFGDRGDPGQRRDGVGRVVGCAGIAPLGEHLGGVDLTRAWQRREDRGVRVCSPRWAMTDRLRFFSAAVSAVSTATWASTASRTASVNASSVLPAGAARNRVSSSAALRRPE